MDEAALQLVQQVLAQQAAALELYARQWCSTPEDVVQEAILRMARERPLPERPVAWLYCAVRRGAITAARGASRRQKHELAAARSADWFVGNERDTRDAEAAALALPSPRLDRDRLMVRLGEQTVLGRPLTDYEARLSPGPRRTT